MALFEGAVICDMPAPYTDADHEDEEGKESSGVKDVAERETAFFCVSGSRRAVGRNDHSGVCF